MKLFLDTSASDFAIAVFNNANQVQKYYVIKNIPKKVKLIPQYVEQICTDLQLKITDFTTFYTNLGPGLFTGVRISLVYLRTISLLTQIKLKTISSIQILQRQNPKDEYKINAMGGKYYWYNNKNQSFAKENIEIKSGEFDQYDSINYTEFIENFNKYESFFTEEKDLINVEPLYIKNPQIGAKK